MAILPPNLDYTDKDFDALRARLHALVPTVFPEWSDFSVASFGTVLLEMFAFVGDVLTFYLDAQARETRLLTATQRQNVIALARMVGYRLHGAHAATAEVVFSRESGHDVEVVLPSGTVVRTRHAHDAVRFRLLEDVRIPPGASSEERSGEARHAEHHIQLTTAHGRAHQEVVLTRRPYLEGSVEVVAGNGVFSEREHLLNSSSTDLHFHVRVDADERATVVFGDGRLGALPTGSVKIIYATGGGVSGNLEAGSLVEIEGAVTDVDGRPVQLRVSQPAAATGGQDRQSLASAKHHVPESIRALTRSVTREDFEIHARRVPGVARALMLTADEDPSIAENSGVLYVVPQGGGIPTESLLEAIHTQVTVTYPGPLTFRVSVQAPVYREVNVAARVFLRPSAHPVEVAQRIRHRLGEAFRATEAEGTPNPRIDFGFNVKDRHGFPAGEIAWSDVFDTVRDTEGVRKIRGPWGDLTLNGHAADVRLKIHEFPILGRVTLLDADTGGALG